MSAPAQVTEAHRKLACEILFECSPSGQATPAGVKAAGQLIAESEAKAVVEIAMVAAASADRNVSLRLENDQLRAEVEWLNTAEANQAKWAHHYFARAERAELRIKQLEELK